MNEIILNNENIKTIIYEIRGVQVLLDRDLAKLYGCTNGTKDINKAVKRNIEKFPNDFYFQLTEDEFCGLKFHFGTSSWNGHGGVRKLPYAFTEQGVAMLSSVLRTENAAKVSIAIMRAFVAMRHYLIENKDIYTSLNNINNKLIEHDKKFDIIFNNFKTKEEKELIIIDGYADKKVLDIIKNLGINVTLIVKTKSLLKKEILKKYKKQYNNLKVVCDDSWHDRYIIIDKSKIYHLGTSLNHIGKKTFNINKLEDNDVIKLLINKVNNISI